MLNIRNRAIREPIAEKRSSPLPEVLPGKGIPGQETGGYGFKGQNSPCLSIYSTIPKEPMIITRGMTFDGNSGAAHAESVPQPPISAAEYSSAAVKTTMERKKIINTRINLLITVLGILIKSIRKVSTI